MRGQNFRQTPICLRRLIDICAAQFYSAACHPLHHLIVPYQTIASNPLVPHPLELPFRRCARHDPTSPVDGRVKRLTRFTRVDSFDDDSIIAHAAADKTALAGKRRRCAFAHDPEFFAVMLFLPGEIMMVMHLLHYLRAKHFTEYIS